MSLLHAAIDVADIETSLAFYDEVLGYEALNEIQDNQGVRNLFVGEGRQPDLQLREVGHAVETSGLDHLGVACEDVDEATARVDPGDVVREPTTLDDLGVRVAFVEDPDGYVVELIQPVD
ncbi:MAG: VOC family protein [Haloarculaceae archaeon]